MSSTAVLQQKSATPRQRAPQLTLELSPASYSAAWFFIVITHAACGTFLICVAITYWFLTTSIMPSFVSMWSLRGVQNYRLYGVVFGIVGAVHGIRVLNLVLMSIRARQLTLRSSMIRTLMSSRILSNRLGWLGKNMAKDPQSASQLRSRPALLRRLVTGPLAQVWNSVFSRRGIFGVESEHFSTVFALQKFLEASSQTYQAYRGSNLLPRSELNIVMVALLVTNCWTTAVIELFLRKSPAVERVLTLTYDATISFAMVIIVPLTIFLPYIEEFNIQYKSFTNPNFLFDPVPIVTMVLENRLIFTASLFDFTTKLIPQLSIMLSLFTVSELLGRGDVKVIPMAEGPSTNYIEVKPQTSGANASKPTESHPPTRDSQNPSRWGDFRALQGWKHVTTVVGFVLWGIIVLTLHSLAAQRAATHEILGCWAVTRPWFSNGKEPCASLVYDCQAQNTTSPDQMSFDKLDHVVLATLTIAHCPGFKMPTDFQRLENLLSLHIYNSTIVNWDADSSVSASVHTRLLSVIVARSQTDAVPEGILQPLPASVMGVIFSHTTLKTLPNDLYQRWHPIGAIAFEYSELTEIPYQMFFSPVFTLSLAGNEIKTIPTLEMLPAGMMISELKLTDNPLKELPSTLTEPSAFIMSIDVQNTSLTEMPAWVKTNTKVVWAYDTPFCATPMADPTLAYQVMCFKRPAGQDVSFPMYLFDALYAYKE